MDTTFSQIIEIYRVDASSQRAKGDYFEQIIKAYFFTDPKYADISRSIWLWKDFPYRNQFGGNDTGVDLVIQTHTGEYWAVQCKCVAEGTYIDKPSVDSFLATSSKSFEDHQGNIFKFSNRIWVSTTNNWSSNATDTLKNQTPPVTRINLYDLETAPVDWEQLEKLVHGTKARSEIWDLKPHQKKAVDETVRYFTNNDRGKLIMACGTGKTFTSLRLAEEVTGGNGMVLFLVPSIALLSQTLREWTAQAREPIDPICICSDPEVSKEKKNSEDTTNFSVIDLALPASTNIQTIKKQISSSSHKEKSLKVVFSTYQSIDVISKVQKELGFEFDLTICDEAHRTTGATRLEEVESSFVKVHDQNIIKSKKRLYMTATPRLYGEDAKAKAAQASIEIASMDDVSKYGEEVYRIGFGEAVEQDLLSDYKVLILTLNESQVPKAVQNAISQSDVEISTDDASKLVGCINALSKHIIGDGGTIDGGDSKEIMRRAVAFTPKISASQKITQMFNEIGETYKESVSEEKKKSLALVKSRHIDGTMDATKRDELMSWLKEDIEDEYESRILTNVRCLSEGVDVPSLDAVMFISAKNSEVDVVQSVGRVMRKSPGKKYGYIIIPVVIPDGVKPEEALNDNKTYKVVWTVLNALRAHDDRFSATVNKIELNKKKPTQIIVGTGDSDGTGEEPVGSDVIKAPEAKQIKMFNDLQNVIFAKLVEKVGDREYWGPQWAKEVETIVKHQIERISKLIKENGDHQKVFQEFLDALHKNINPATTETQAVEMLAQHIITRPIFEALFEDYSFVKNNAVSASMQQMGDLIDALDEKEDTTALDKFYAYIRRRAEKIDNSEAKQKIITELYESFFKIAFPKMAEQLGIVFTPVEVADFIIHSVNDVLKKEFGRSLSDENVNILDPFSGTGTFITRLLQSGVIDKKDLKRKYEKEIFANEIVLLSYYIGAVNIENTYHDLSGSKEFKSFEGMLFTDTFQLAETEGQQVITDALTENSKRVNRQKNTPIQVIIGNPPYSVGQKSANDNASNQKYKKLDYRIAKTYVAESITSMNKANYDAYIKAFRWSTDRLDPKHGGIIAFVSNGSWLDGNTTSGFRKVIEKEFSSIYVFNLRGNQRTSGELSRKEGGKIFGSGSRTPISITLLVKNPKTTNKQATINYHDIGNFLSREEKLAIVNKFKTVASAEMKWKTLKPNKHGDWLNQRNDLFSELIPLADKSGSEPSFFQINSNGFVSGRDPWVVNSSQGKIVRQVHDMTRFYNRQREEFHEARKTQPHLKVTDFISNDETKIKWVQNMIRDLENNKNLDLDRSKIVKTSYRPFFRQFYLFQKDFNWSRYLQPKLYPTPDSQNIVIYSLGIGSSKDFCSFISDNVISYDFLEKAQGFPLFYYEERQKNNPSLFDAAENSTYIRRDAISDYIFESAKQLYNRSSVTKEDIFYYVYGFLHSPEYRKTFANDLKKMLPRLPLVEKDSDFWEFSKAGRELANLHLNYEKVLPYPGLKVSGVGSKNFIVSKMKFVTKGKKDTIIYNDDIRISNIPENAYEYVVNGKSAIEWIMDRYQVKVDKASGIKNDPNDWAKEVKNPRYILDLLLSVINVSVKTVDIVNSLPKLSFDSNNTN